MTCCAILTDTAVGGTFLSWSWHWLKGDTQYFYVEENHSVDLVTTPLNYKNSHKFLPNQPISIDTFYKIFNNQHRQHIYFHNFRDLKTDQAIEQIKNSDCKTVLVTKSQEYVLYPCSIVVRSNAVPSFVNPGTNLINHKEILLDQLEYFFSKDLDAWRQQNLNNVWDLREFMALNQRPFDNNTIRNCHKFDFEVFDLPAVDIWKNLDTKINDWFDYCETNIDNSRLDSWKEIYKQWKTVHLDRMQFCEQFDYIVNGIIENQNIDLEKFNLDIVREAAIQHALIYRHNLNLKTWQLEKFKNTQQLHNLLEPNIHPIKQ